MAYSGYSYQDWSVATDYQPTSTPTTWEWDGHRESGQHAPMRMQHGYSEETGHYVYEAGSLREDDPYRIQPRTSATRRITSGSTTSHSHRSGEDDKPSSSSSSRRRRDEKEKSSRVSGGSRTTSEAPAHEPSSTRSRGSHHHRHHHAPPRTPTIERLATPELAPLSAGLRFCSCGCSDGLHDEEERYMQGREKMDSQLHYAVRHVSSRR